MRWVCLLIFSQHRILTGFRARISGSYIIYNHLILGSCLSSFSFSRWSGSMVSSEPILKSSNPTNSPVRLHSTIPFLYSFHPSESFQPLLVISCSTRVRFCWDIWFVVLAACRYLLNCFQGRNGKDAVYNIVSFLVALAGWLLYSFT